MERTKPYHKNRLFFKGMFPELRKLGEALTENYPQNDCAVYLSIYEAYNRIAADYDRIMELMPDVSNSTMNALNARLCEYHHELYEMYKNNYAIKKYREEHNL